MDPHEFVRIYASENRTEIDMIKQFLESEGFTVMARGEYEPEYPLFYPNPIELCVPRRETDEAVMLLREFQDAPIQDDQDPSLADFRPTD
ncbi:MAG: hypothetical protein ABEK03_07045 [Candidatus Bipolaricaulia bacterium]